MTVDEVANNTQKESRSSRRRRNREAAAKSQQKQVAAQVRDKDRPTPSQRETNKPGGGNFITRFFRGIVEYFTSTGAELRKVTWPSRQDSLRLSGIVLVVTLVSSIVLGTLDYLYGQLFRWGISAPIVFVIFFGVLALVYAGVMVTRRQRG